jgi:hypothetical protein
MCINNVSLDHVFTHAEDTSLVDLNLWSSTHPFLTPLDYLQQVLQINLHLQNADPRSTIPAPAAAASIAAFCSSAPTQPHSRGVPGLPHPNGMRAPPSPAPPPCAHPPPPRRSLRLPVRIRLPRCDAPGFQPG